MRRNKDRIAVFGNSGTEGEGDVVEGDWLDCSGGEVAGVDVACWVGVGDDVGVGLVVGCNCIAGACVFGSSSMGMKNSFMVLGGFPLMFRVWFMASMSVVPHQLLGALGVLTQ